jgi:hypothetical protein
MPIDTRDPLNYQGSNDGTDASCPICGADITGFEATASGPRNAECGHRLAQPANSFYAGGVLNGA